MDAQDDQIDEMQEVIQEFLAESAEGLDQMDNDLVGLEADPGNQDLLASVFRTIHTIKGTCGFLGFSKLESVTHAGENLLSRLRDRELALSAPIATVLLSLVDAVRGMISAIQCNGTEGDADFEPLVETLRELVEQQGGAPDAGRKKARNSRARKNLGNEHARASATPAQAVTHDTGRGQQETLPHDTPQPGQAQQAAGEPAVAENAIRVDVDILDNLMNLVGELVLARNQIMQHIDSDGDSAFVSVAHRLNVITSDLQRDIMKTRMQPINTIWKKFPRLVRDLAATCGKRVTIETTGKETELDKSLIEAMSDPLTHLVRNALDHGLETPDQRTALSKPADGRLSLRAYHEDGQVIVEIADDGAGIDVQRVAEKAIEKGFITAAQASQLTQRELARLIFMPGFSTAEAVTNISGRGVGMDVVKTNIEKIGGFIELETVPQQGTTIRIQLPLTLAIISALLVGSGAERFAIPQASVIELIRVDHENGGTGIEMVHGVPVYRLRGQLLPLLYLDRELAINDARAETSAVNIVVLHADQRRFGLIVDTIDDSQEIVVKPLSKSIKRIEVFAGSTIMGDGRVALILDVLGLAQRARLLSQTRIQNLELSAPGPEQDCRRQHHTIVVVQTLKGERIAIPFDNILRLEEFPVTMLEQAGAQLIVQYRDEILPLLNLSDLLTERRRRSRKPASAVPGDHLDAVQTLVYDLDGRHIGLLVEKILDIVEHDFAVQGPSTRAGVLGTTVIGNQVIEVFNTGTLEKSFVSMFPPAHTPLAATR